MTDTVRRNIESVHKVRKEADDDRRLDHVAVDKLASFAGTTTSLYLHLGIYSSWLLAVCSVTTPKFPLTMEAIWIVGTLEAIILATLVLINQRRMNAVERKNSDLHLQMSMLTEHEITRLAQLTDLIAKRLGVESGQIENFNDVKRDVHPDEVLQKISQHEKAVPTDSTNEVK